MSELTREMIDKAFERKVQRSGLFVTQQPKPCTCKVPHLIYQHWYCEEHGWAMRTRLLLVMHVSDEFAADYGWVR